MIDQPECSQQLGSATKEEEARKKSASLNEEIPELCQSPQRKSSKSGINLRKSLAWDSAFFTCEGTTDSTVFFGGFFCCRVYFEFREKMVRKGRLVLDLTSNLLCPVKCTNQFL